MSKTVFITGGNAGIGRATALLFAKEGFNVAVMGRRESENERVRQEVQSAGARCITFSGDVSVREDVARAVSGTVDEFGGLHHAFNNAGVEQIPTPLVEQSDNDYKKIMDVNVKGVWMCMQCQIPELLKSGGGSIVNTSSVAGHIGMAQIPLYIASKHAVNGLTKAIALEYAQQNIRVNSVCPGAVVTDLYDRFTGKNPEMEQAIENMHPMGRSGQPEEIAKAVLYLCRDASWMTGQSLLLDGGFTAQ